jgi:DNA-binding transcriptional regulator YdaS (Cro superfamily)
MPGKHADLDKLMRTIRATRGLSVRIAAACGVHRSAVYQWTKVPPQHMMAVAEIMGIQIEDVRPDLFRRSRRKDSPVAKTGQPP